MPYAFEAKDADRWTECLHDAVFRHATEPKRAKIQASVKTSEFAGHKVVRDAAPATEVQHNTRHRTDARQSIHGKERAATLP